MQDSSVIEPSIDGIALPGEWDGAAKFSFYEDNKGEISELWVGYDTQSVFVRIDTLTSPLDLSEYYSSNPSQSNPSDDLALYLMAPNAINYNAKASPDCDTEDCIDSDESLCIYDMCTDYLPNSLSSSEYVCDDSVADGSLYSVGDQLRCDDAEEVYSICYPENCSNTFKLADFYGKAIYILIETSW